MLKTVSPFNTNSPVFSGDVTLTNGNLVVGTSGKGIDFSATSGSGTSELFSDYEEGTFNVTAQPDTGSITFSSNTLRYTKIGRVVHISGTLVVQSVNSPTNNVFFQTLPFVCGASCGGGGFAVDSTNAFSGDIGFFINGGQNALYIYYRDTNGNFVASAPIFKAGTTIRVDVSYTV